VSAGLEAEACEEFLYSRLANDATLATLVNGVFVNLAPQPTAYPLVVMQEMSGIDYAAVGSFRIWTNFMYLVKVIGQTASYGDLKAAVARIDALLHRASGPAGDGTIWACIREQVIRMPEYAPGGQQFRHSGAMYRVFAS
jgi:Protein of unknown function (DUF3168)